MIQVRLKELLEARGKSRYWLAQETGIQFNTLTRIERAESSNRIELRVLDEICRALQCQPGDLLIFVDKPEPASTRAKKGTRKAK
jgi:putative transcriptional regulator